MIALGVDVGGTFTDLILADLSENRVTIHKTPSTPVDPSEGVISIHQHFSRPSEPSLQR